MIVWNSLYIRVGFIKFGNRDNVQVMDNQIVHDHTLTDSGGNQDSDDFARQEELDPPFEIKYIEWCFTYLTKCRNYKHIDGNSDQVKFGDAQNWTDCFLAGPKTPGGSKSQFKTGHDLNLGTLSQRPVQNSLTYQFYTKNSEPDAIAMGVPITARLESIAIEMLKPNHVIGSKLNYHNAALLELYREKKKLPSLKGTCERKNETQLGIESGLENLSI